MFRKTVFWTHLCVGIAVGLVVLMMSLTGVLLTYEKQMVAWAESAMDTAAPSASAQPLSTSELLGSVKRYDQDFEATSVRYRPDPAAPAWVRAGRSSYYYVNRWNGEVLEDETASLRRFFSAVVGWHRWFNVSRENRDLPRAITGASNLLFLFLIFSGLYLWLPPVMRRVAFRTRLFINSRAKTSKARDYNWHHVFGFWISIPLAVVVASALVFSYGWAGRAVYSVYGEEPPARQSSSDSAASANAAGRKPADALDTVDQTLAGIAASEPGWRAMQVEIPGPGMTTVKVSVDSGSGGEPQKRYDVAVDSLSGAIVSTTDFSSNSPGRQARIILRFLHTGEVLGVAGQTIAGLVSLLSLLMVWTGLALAWRRLLSPLFRRRAPGEDVNTAPQPAD